MRLLDSLLEYLFPDVCVGCRRRGGLLCAACLSVLPPAPLPERHFIHSAFSYCDPRVSRLVWMLKYENGRRVARIFAPAMADMLAEYVGEESWFMGKGGVALVPIPLSKERRKFRGYNQAELLAQEIRNVRPLNVRVETGIVAKIRHTAPQARLSRRALRLYTQDGAFMAFESRELQESLVVLVDDVSTTGATLESARNALTQKGYRRVIALTIAH